MRFPLFLLVIVSVSAFSAPVTDFAPDQVGNVWKYQVIYTAGPQVGAPAFDSSNYSKTFKLIKSLNTQEPKIFIFDIIDSGIDCSQGALKIFQQHYFDTCFQFGDTFPITSSINKLSSFFPFFRTHGIDSQDSGMKKLLYKNDSLFLFTTSFTIFSGLFVFYNVSYMQNIGLFSETKGYGGTITHSFEYLTISLISCTIVPTSVVQIPKKFDPVQATRQNVANAYIYDLQGRRFQYRSLSALPPGLMINRGVNYLQVK